MTGWRRFLFNARIRPYPGRAIRPALPALLATALAACAHAPLREELASEPAGDHRVGVAVRYEARDEAAAAQVLRALPGAVALADRWGPFTAPITITIHPTHDALETASRHPDHPWLRAWARPAGIELQTPRTWSRGHASDAELAQLLAHELTHCAMYQAVGGDARIARTIPVWFREGMATSNAGESLAPPSGPTSLAVTPAQYQGDSQRVYATADHAFRRLLQAYGAERIRAVLARMRGGMDFEGAFRDAIGVSVSQFEADLRAAVLSG